MAKHPKHSPKIISCMLRRRKQRNKNISPFPTRYHLIHIERTVIRLKGCIPPSPPDPFPKPNDKEKDNIFK